MSSIPPTQKSVFVNDSMDQVNNIQEINANFDVPVAVETEMLNWKVSTTVGVKQDILERTRKNKLRLTTLVKLPAGHIFNRLGHEGGVEFFVLSGVLSNSDGDCSAGCYVRIPAGSYCKYFTSDGCTILLKLGCLLPFDRKPVVINTRNPAARWLSVGEPGVSRLGLHHFSEEVVSLYRIRSECWVIFKYQNHGVEVFVCEGSIYVQDNRYATGNWLRYPAGSRIKISAIGGACLYVKKSVFPTTDFSVACERVENFKL